MRLVLPPSPAEWVADQAGVRDWRLTVAPAGAAPQRPEERLPDRAVCLRRVPGAAKAHFGAGVAWEQGAGLAPAGAKSSRSDRRCCAPAPQSVWSAGLDPRSATEPPPPGAWSHRRVRSRAR